MVARIAGLLFGFARWVLAAIGLAVVVLVVWLASGDRQPELQAAVEVPVVESCDCAAGAVCSGPRGGRYCLKPDGAKRYIGK